VLRRPLLGCLLVAAALSLASWSPLAGAAFAVCVVLSPGLVAMALNRVRDRPPLEF